MSPPIPLPDLLKRSPINSPSNSKYAVIIDAGSSGSRLFVYRWPDPLQYKFEQAGNKTAQQSLLPLHLDESWKKKVNPGISSYSNKIDKVWSGHLQDLIKHAQNIIPAEDHFSTPIYFLATAGMRLLPDKDQKNLLSQVCSSLKKHTNFYLPECQSHVSVIDGETEGLYGWLALNYLLGPIKEYENNSGHSYGFMDMGGASAQIAFAPNKTETQRHLDDLYGIHLRTLDGKDHEWKVFVSTWLGFGANEARKRLSEYLILNNKSLPSHNNNNGKNNEISDPCSPPGYSFNFYDGTSTNTTIVGTGDFDHCLNQLIPLLNKGLPCKDDPCLFNGIHVPAIDFNYDKMVGVSEYWYTANDIFDMGGKYDFSEFSTKAKDFCSLSWDTIQKNNQKGLYKDMPKDHLSTACFKAAWIVNILHEGFGVPLSDNDKNVLLELNKRAAILSESGNDIERRNIHNFLDPYQSAISIDGIELTWTLGKAMLYASSQIPASPSNQIQVGYMPASILQQPFVNGGETISFQIPSHSNVSKGYIFIILLVVIFWCIFAFFKSFFTNGHYVPRRIFTLSSIPSKFRHITYPVYSYFLKLTGNGKSYMDQSKDDSDRLLEEGLGDSDLVLKSYPDSPHLSFTPRRMKSSASLGKSTSMLDLNTAPSRVSSRLSMRPESFKPLTSLDMHDYEG